MGDESRKDRETRIMANPDLMDMIFDHIACGGVLTELAETLGIRYGALSRYAYDDKARSDRFQDAMKMRKEYFGDVVEMHMRDIATQDIRALFDDSGNLKPMGQWSDKIARAVASVKPTEWGIEIKLHDKIKALHLHGKEHGKYVDKVEHSGTLKLDEIIGESFKIKKDA